GEQFYAKDQNKPEFYPEIKNTHILIKIGDSSMYAKNAIGVGIYPKDEDGREFYAKDASDRFYFAKDNKGEEKYTKTKD
ncbi:hypothetical protein NPIL_19411, partial [Nephila pilipes]